MKNTDTEKYQNMKKHLSEGLLIVFSVLFALMINSLVESRKTQKQKRAAKLSLIKELKNNKDIVMGWQTRHRNMQETLSTIAFGKNDSLKNELKKYKYLNFGVIFEHPNLIDELLQKTSWESVQRTEVLNGFEFETIESLSKAYDLQDVITEKTIMRLIEHYYEKESLDIQNLEITLAQLSIMMGELVGQEYMIPRLYEDAIKSLESE